MDAGDAGDASDARGGSIRRHKKIQEQTYRRGGCGGLSGLSGLSGLPADGRAPPPIGRKLSCVGVGVGFTRRRFSLRVAVFTAVRTRRTTNYGLRLDF